MTKTLEVLLRDFLEFEKKLRTVLHQLIDLEDMEAVVKVGRLLSEVKNDIEFAFTSPKVEELATLLSQYQGEKPAEDKKEAKKKKTNEKPAEALKRKPGKKTPDLSTFTNPKAKLPEGVHNPTQVLKLDTALYWAQGAKAELVLQVLLTNIRDGQRKRKSHYENSGLNLNTVVSAENILAEKIRVVFFDFLGFELDQVLDPNDQRVDFLTEKFLTSERGKKLWRQVISVLAWQKLTTHLVNPQYVPDPPEGSPLGRYPTALERSLTKALLQPNLVRGVEGKTLANYLKDWGLPQETNQDVEIAQQSLAWLNEQSLRIIQHMSATVTEIDYGPKMEWKETQEFLDFHEERGILGTTEFLRDLLQLIELIQVKHMPQLFSPEMPAPPKHINGSALVVVDDHMAYPSDKRPHRLNK